MKSEDTEALKYRGDTEYHICIPYCIFFVLLPHVANKLNHIEKKFCKQFDRSIKRMFIVHSHYYAPAHDTVIVAVHILYDTTR